MSKNKNEKLNNGELNGDALSQAAGGQAWSRQASGITEWEDLIPHTKNGGLDWRKWESALHFDNGETASKKK